MSSITKSKDHKTIFCETIVGMAVGGSVSKLDLGNILEDESERRIEITTTLIMPTERLIRIIPLLEKQLYDSRSTIKENLNE